MTTTNNLPFPPDNIDVIWQPVRREHQNALGELQAVSASYDGTPLDILPLYQLDFERALGPAGVPPVGDTLCAITPDGRMVASGWLFFREDAEHEYRICLCGVVHPLYRGQGLGRFLLSWTEARAHQLLAERSPLRATTLRIEFFDERPTAERLYRRQGFQQYFTEYRMQRDLTHPLPAVSLEKDIQLVNWTTERAPLFFQVHEDAWTTRPGHRPSNYHNWTEYWASGDQFRADLSLLAMIGDEGVGFALCEVDDEQRTGWISKIGVRPNWRRRRIASGLLNTILYTFKAEGLATASLEVGADNPTAQRVYEHLGFQVVGYRTLYGKTIPIEP